MSRENVIKGDDSPSYLVHHGRKGMKWHQHIYGDDRAGGYSTGAKPVSAMTDEELRKAVDRKRMESQYKHFLVGKNSEAFSRFDRRAGMIVGGANAIGSGLQIAGSLSKKQRMQDVGKLVGAASKAAANGVAAVRKSDEINQKKLRNEIDLSDVSDAELLKYVNRKNLEQQYAYLSNEDIVTGQEVASSLNSYMLPMSSLSKNVVAFKRGGKPDDDVTYAGEQKKKSQGNKPNGNAPAAKKAK